MISAPAFELDCSKNDPVHRLVGAIVGSNRNNAHVIALANRVLSSQIGTNSKDNCQDGAVMDLSSTWRRIARKARKPNSKKEIEELYSLYENEFPANENSDLPAKVIMTLTKLMGKRIQAITPSPKLPPLIERKTPMQLKMMTNLTSIENDTNKIETSSIVAKNVLGSSINTQNDPSRLSLREGAPNDAGNLEGPISSYQQQRNNPLISSTSLPESDTHTSDSQVLRQSKHCYAHRKKRTQARRRDFTKRVSLFVAGD